MATPAESVGLGGSALLHGIRTAFGRIPKRSQIDLLEAIHAEASRRHLIYLRDGEWDTIRVLACPLAALPDQLAYVNWVSLTIQNAIKRLPEIYLHDPEVRRILQLQPEEEEWLRRCWGPSHREHNPVFGRLDAVADFTSPRWQESLHFVEPNLSGIGGLHLVPTAESIVLDLVLPVLRALDEELELEPVPDIRELLMQEAIDHMTAIGRPARTLCFVEPKYAGTGPDEQAALARHFEDRYGTRTLHADPAELEAVGDEVFYEGQKVDVAYRDYPIADLIELQRCGVDVRPMRNLLQQNRMISSVAGDLDHKSCWEILTDPTFTEKYFNADERLAFRRHVLWTRILADRQTLLPDGTSGDLLPYVRCHQESLVLKPNRDYGGHGVILGPAVSRAGWESIIQDTLAGPDVHVVQGLTNIPVMEFPVLEQGTVTGQTFYTVLGFAASRYGLAVLGRASQKQVVNVAQRGGMCVMLTGRAPARLVGPSRTTLDA
jgi:hypothetical protein